MEDSPSYGNSSRGGGGRSFGGGSGFRGGSGRFGGPKPFRPSPVRVGEEYEVKIDSLSKRGDSGVARVQGLVIFVPGTNVGDSVKVRITKVGRGYATAETVGGSSESASSDSATVGAEQEQANEDTTASQ